MKTKDRVGAAFPGLCPVDVEEWQKKNRIELQPAHQYRWILLRTDRDEPTEDDVKRTATAVMNKWIGEGVTDLLPGSNAAADLLGIEILNGPYAPGGGTRREDLPGPPPTIEIKKAPLYVVVSWAFRGALKRSIPWPTRKGAMMQLKIQADCPVGADWALQESIDEGDAPAQKSEAEKLAEVIGKAAADAASGLFKGAGLTLSIFAVAGVAAYFFFKGKD